jgi:hypothetical protein
MKSKNILTGFFKKFIFNHTSNLLLGIPKLLNKVKAKLEEVGTDTLTPHPLAFKARDDLIMKNISADYQYSYEAAHENAQRHRQPSCHGTKYK